MRDIHPTTPAFSILDVGRRIHALDAAHEKLDTTGATRRDEACMKILGDERDLLQDLVLVLKPETLAEAAVQVAIMGYTMGGNSYSDDPGELRACLEKIRSALPNIARLTAAEANIDLAQFGPGDTLELMDRLSPSTEPVVLEQPDRPQW